MNFVGAVSGVAARNHLHARLGFDTRGTTVIEAQAPKGDVVVMRAPIGHGAAGIFPPITESGVAALLHVRNRGRLALPEIPIEAGRNGRFAEGTIAQAFGQIDDDLFEFSDAAVLNQFAGETEFRVAALLAAGLENDF